MRWLLLISIEAPEVVEAKAEKTERSLQILFREK
jgi:hypothetical protein